MSSWPARLIALPGLCALLSSGLFAVAMPAQAFSNTNTFTAGSARVVIEDVAICTKFKYTFDPSTNTSGLWSQIGYETCPSESLTAESLPATLHMKFRLQSINPDEFLASYADASILDAKGVRVSTPRWAPTPHTNLDGPFNQRDAVYYAAFSLADPKLFLVGSYTVNLQFWNSQWSKIKGTAEEVPSNLNVFSFNIYAGKTSSAANGTNSSSSSEPCKWDDGISASLTKTRSMLAIYTQKVNALTDFSAPGIMELLDAYLSDIKKDSLNIIGLVNLADSQYRNSKNCDGYLSFVAESASYSAELAKTQALISGYYAKAKASAGTKEPAIDPNWCVDQSAAAISSLKGSISIFGQYSTKADSGIDLANVSTTPMLKDWLAGLDSEFKNVLSWQSKLPEYLKSQPSCTTFVSAQSLAEEGVSTYKKVVAKINSLITRVESAESKPKSKNDENFADDDGIEEEPQANLAVSYSNSLSRYIIKVESNLPEESLTIRATKKGARALRFTINTDEEGNGGLRTKTKLSGYTLTLYFGSEKLDSVRAR